MADILIVGAGFTGSRVAGILRSEGHRVVTTHRQPMPDSMVLNLPNTAPLTALAGHGWLVLWSVPAVDGIGALAGKAARIVYLSTTGVYGAQRVVDERTCPAPETERAKPRLAAERQVQTGRWASCILRPAAIYGPGRGAQESIRQGRWRIAGEGLNYTSRIHVDDLAALSAAALTSDLTGAWPVADLEPSTNIEITRFCCDLLQLPLPSSARVDEVDETRRADRRVDGRAICAKLGVTLRYPSYRIGVPAALAAAS